MLVLSRMCPQISALDISTRVMLYEVGDHIEFFFQSIAVFELVLVVTRALVTRAQTVSTNAAVRREGLVDWKDQIPGKRNIVVTFSVRTLGIKCLVKESCIHVAILGRKYTKWG